MILQLPPGPVRAARRAARRGRPGVRGAALEAAIDRAVVIGRHRTLTQDSEFGIAQIVEIAIRALSPAVNDTFTGVACVDWLADALLVLAEKPPLEGNWYDAAGELRVWMPAVRLERARQARVRSDPPGVGDDARGADPPARRDPPPGAAHAARPRAPRSPTRRTRSARPRRPRSSRSIVATSTRRGNEPPRRWRRDPRFGRGGAGRSGRSLVAFLDWLARPSARDQRGGAPADRAGRRHPGARARRALVGGVRPRGRAHAADPARRRGASATSLPIVAIICAILADRLLLVSPDDRRVPERRRLVHGREGEPRARAGLLAGAALAIDYMLNVAVGISAGVGALVSAFPPLLPHTLALCLGILALLTLVNLRGMRGVRRSRSCCRPTRSSGRSAS